jgi:hypothetical protein
VHHAVVTPSTLIIDAEQAISDTLTERLMHQIFTGEPESLSCRIGTAHDEPRALSSYEPKTSDLNRLNSHCKIRQAIIKVGESRPTLQISPFLVEMR